MIRDLEWWKARATKRYRERLGLECRIRAALAKHSDCWPDDPCSELARDIRVALGECD